MRRISLSICLALALLYPQLASAGGFLLYEHGASATGMASARTALSDDVNALYFNPAAITELKGLNVQLGITGVLPFNSYEAAGVSDRSYTRADGSVVPINDGLNDADTNTAVFTPIHTYITYEIPDSGVSLGYALFNPFGLGTDWPEDWDGRFIATHTEVATFYNQATIALDIAKIAGFKDHLKLSIAGGYNFVYGQAALAKKIDLRVIETLSSSPDVIGAEGKMDMEGDGIGHGWNAALFLELPELLAFGFSYRSGVELDIEGDAKFSLNPAAEAAVGILGTRFPDSTKGAVTLDLPQHFNLGLAYLGVENLKIAADFYYAFFESYDELAISFECAQSNPATCDLRSDPIEKKWGATWQASIGAEYTLMQHIPLRLGYGRVSTPVPSDTYDPSLPDGDRNLFTAGAGYDADDWYLDFGYMLALWSGTKDNEVGGQDPAGNPNGKANGDYSTHTHLFALSAGARFF